MRTRSPGALLTCVGLTLAFQAACGKRADPLAPYVKTPQPPSALEVSQVGEEVEIRVMAPRVTTENRPLPVLELNWLQAPPLGTFDRGAVSLLREEVAPGEIRVKRFPRPTTEMRISVEASAGKARSAPAAPVAYKPAPVPLTPTAFEVVNAPEGVILRWVNPPGAEPWPSPTPFATVRPPGTAPAAVVSGTAPVAAPGPTPNPTPNPSATPSALPAPPPVPVPVPVPAPTPTPAVVASPSPVPAGAPTAPQLPGTGVTTPSPSPTATPTPTPMPPTGIRIFRTDGIPRLAREPLQAATWTDLGLKPGDKPCYALRYVASFLPLVESASTEPLCVEVKDLVLPLPPGRVVGDIGDSFVEISWVESPSADVSVYRVYRTLEGGAQTLVVESPANVRRIRDLDMTRGPRVYEVVAVDAASNLSPAGPPLRIVLP